VIAFVASNPASYVTGARYTMGGEWKRESETARDVDGTWHGRATNTDTEGRGEER
jgi:hypothetical protein